MTGQIHFVGVDHTCIPDTAYCENRASTAKPPAPTIQDQTCERPVERGHRGRRGYDRPVAQGDGSRCRCCTEGTMFRVFSSGAGIVRTKQCCGRPHHSEGFYGVAFRLASCEGRSASYHLAAWRLARFKALSALRRSKDVGMEEEAANAIEDTSDDPEVVCRR